jgi:hypothetical protein
MAAALSAAEASHELHSGPGNLDLTPDIKAGLSVVSAFALLSFFTCLALFVHLVYKIVRWQREQSRLWRKSSSSSGPAAAAARGAPEVEMPTPSHAPLAHFPLHGVSHVAPSSHHAGGHSRAPNQFLVLVVNLLLADIKQATAFALNLSWIHRNYIDANTRICWAQGWFVSVGDLAVCCYCRPGPAALWIFGD